MPRVTAVKKAQKKQGACGKCGAEIKKGEPYRWWKFRYGGRRVRCMKPGCSPRGSDLTQSKMSGVYSAQEAVEDALEAFRKDFSLDDLKSAVEEAAESVREVAGEYRESAENIESGFNHETTQSQELAEKADTLESAADELEGCINADDFDEDSVEVDGVENPDDMEDDDIIESLATVEPKIAPGDWAKLNEDDRKNKLLLRRKELRDKYDEAKKEVLDEARENWADEVASEVEGALGNLDC